MMVFETLITKEILLSVVALAFVMCLIMSIFEVSNKIEFIGEDDK